MTDGHGHEHGHELVFVDVAVYVRHDQRTEVSA
jgi:hypothetical protein